MTTDELADKFMDGLVCRFVERKDIVELIELAKDCAIVEVVGHLQKRRAPLGKAEGTVAGTCGNAPGTVATPSGKAEGTVAGMVV